MYYIGLDVHKRTISYCVKDAAGRVQMEGKIGSTRRELEAWIKTLPQPHPGLPGRRFGKVTSWPPSFQDLLISDSERTFASRHLASQHVPRPALQPRARDQFPCLVEVESRGRQAHSDDEEACP